MASCQRAEEKKKSVFNSLCIILYKVHVYYSHSSSQLLPVGCSTLLISAASAQTNVTQTGSCYPSVCVKVPLRGRRREKAVVVNLQDHTPAREWGWFSDSPWVLLGSRVLWGACRLLIELFVAESKWKFQARLRQRLNCAWNALPIMRALPTIFMASKTLSGSPKTPGEAENCPHSPVGMWSHKELGKE